MIYEIGWYWYEEEIHEILEHDEEFSKEEFQRMFRVSLYKTVDGLLSRNYDGWIGLEVAFDCYEEGYESVADIICKEYGFKRVKPVGASEFGGFIIKGDCEEDARIGEWLGSERYNAVVKHNKETERDLYERRLK